MLINIKKIKDKEKKLKKTDNDNMLVEINISVFIYLFIASVAIICDWITFGLKFDFLKSFYIAIIINLFFIVFILRKKIKIINLFRKIDSIPIIIFLIFSIPQLFISDNKFDTGNYHLYTQSNFFSDKINFDYFFNSYFFFALGDKMNYIIRYFTSLRLGTLLTFCTPIVFYFISKKILSKFDINGIKQTIYSSTILVLLMVNYRFGTYHVDNLGVVFMLELFYTVLNKELFKNKKVILYQSFLIGITIGIKIYNIIWCIVIVIFELLLLIVEYKKEFWNQIKKIKIITIFCALVVFFIPWVSYAIYNYLEVGNPFFPFLDSIFNSSYINNSIIRKIVKFGPNSLKEVIFWFILGVNKSLEVKIDLTYAAGVFFSLWYIIFKKKKDDAFYISIFILISTYVWTIFMYGYARYAIILAIIDNLFSFIIIDYLIKNKKTYFTNLKGFFKTFWIFILVIYNIAFGVKYKYTMYKTGINYELKLISYLNKGYRYVANEKIEIDGVWAAAFNSGRINLIRNQNTPIYNLYVSRDIDYPTSKISLEEQYKIRNELIGKDVYTICSVRSFEKFKQRLSELNVDVVSYYEYDNYYYQNPGEEWYIIKINVREIDIESYIEYMNENEIKSLL